MIDWKNFLVINPNGALLPGLDLSNAIEIANKSIGSVVHLGERCLATSPINEAMKNELIIQYIPTYKVVLPDGKVFAGLLFAEGAISVAQKNEGSAIFTPDAEKIAQSPFTEEEVVNLLRSMPDLALCGD
jgi:hypothetical protein